MKSTLQKFGLLIALAVVCGAMSWAQPETFPTVSNLVTVVRQISINGILAVGVTFVILTGGVDLSLGSVVALTGVVTATCSGLPAPVAIAFGILSGLLCGAVNGLVVTRGRVASFIVTLGMMTIARGLALVVSKGRPVSIQGDSIKQLGGDIAGIPVPVVLLVVVALLAWVFLTRMRVGRHIYAVGGNEKAARAAGVGVENTKLLAYAVCGALAGLAGVVLAARINTGQPNAGVAYELDAIAAVVIGGTSLSGGVGGVGGTMLGALLMGVINNGLDLLGVNSYYQQIIKGLIIVGAVLLDRRSLSR
jgi:ribose/xylose/arabinose/galactoside ABC-type transport system permease subunit